MTNSRTRTVPSSPLARVFGFGQLAAGLAMGTVAEAVRQSVRGGDDAGGAQGGGNTASGGQQARSSVKQYVASDANAERLAETLCRMRGAALKLGQMLSIQVYWCGTSRRQEMNLGMCHLIAQEFDRFRCAVSSLLVCDCWCAPAAGYNRWSIFLWMSIYFNILRYRATIRFCVFCKRAWLASNPNRTDPARPAMHRTVL